MMKPKKIVLKLTQGQREHVKMLTGLGPARLHIEIAPKAEVPFGKPWSTKMASTAVRLTDDQKEQFKEGLNKGIFPSFSICSRIFVSSSSLIAPKGIAMMTTSFLQLLQYNIVI